MDYLPPFVVHGTHMMTEQEIEDHGEDYRKIITALRDGMIDLEAGRKSQRLNSDTDRIIMK
jgi:glutathione-regulated potassium-efflux system ancillary protein KefG